MTQKRKTPTMNLMKLMADYDTDSECRAVLEQLRWPDGVRCPRCEGQKIYRAPKQNARQEFDCASCGYQFSVTAGTIFHDSKLGLPKWFVAVYLMCESKKGISANQMKRTIGVSYKTAWYLCHRIRAAMGAVTKNPLRGIVEVDETFIGGKKRGVGRGQTKHKTLVIGAVERDGQVRLKVGKRRTKRALHGFINSVVHDEAEAIHTDEWEPYKGIEDHNTRHETVNHAQDEWVRGAVHTNTVESVWSLMKRSIVGSYHHLSVKHLPAYLDEMAFRYNNRENEYLFRDTLMALVGAQAMPYQELIQASSK